MKFLRNLLAVIVGFFISLFLLFFIFFIFVGVVAAVSGDKEVTVKKNSVLVLDLTDNIVDRGKKDPFANLDLGMFQQESKIGLNEILKSIENAKTDSKIKGIVLKTPYIRGGAATINEIRQKLEEFKEESGKFLYSYSNYGYSQGAYYLSSVADSIFFNPVGNLSLVGLGGERSFYPRMFEKMGIEPQIIRHGKYKSAVEPYMLEKMSAESREQTMKYVGSMWNQMLEAISESRGISIAKLNEIADEVSVRKAEDAVTHNLVDGLYYADEFEAMLRNELNVASSDEVNYISVRKYKDAPNSALAISKSKNRIAVVYSEGPIYGDGDGQIGPKLAETLREVREDEDVKAVVLRINSPGGSAVISDFIWREVELISQSKPIVASMGDVAASGGYYMACAADTIVAMPNTITGSIGVFGVLFSGEKLIKETLGILTDSYGTNKNTNLGGGYPLPIPLASRKLNDFEQNLIQESVEDVYDTFISHVAEGRGISKEEVDRIGQGRVWIGEDAKELGLVDVLGDLEDAIEIAIDMAKVEDYKLVAYPKLKDPIEEMLEGLSAKVTDHLVKRELGENHRLYKQVKELMKHEGILTYMPDQVYFE